MSYVFTDFFRQQLFINQALMNGATVQMVFFANYASFTDPQDPRYTGLRTVADLQAVLGWGPALPASNTQVVNSTVPSGSNSRYLLANNPFVNDVTWTDAKVVAGALVLKTATPLAGVTDPIIFITDTPFGSVMRKQDQFSALPDTKVTPNRPLFAWQIPSVGATQLFPVEGSLTVLAGPPNYEPSHQQHCWLYPQRVNLLANPSFEGGTNHWRTNATLTRAAGGAPGGGVFQAHVNGTGSGMKKAPFYLMSGKAATTDSQFVDVPFTVKAKVNVPTGATESSIVRHGVTSKAWRLYFINGEFRMALSYDGTTEDKAAPPVFTTAELAPLTASGQPFYIGVEVFSSVGFVAYQGITSSDGLTWSTATPLKSYDVGVKAVYVSEDVFQIGGTSWTGTCYWASLDFAGRRLWRFDASAAYLRTSWNGPQGELWTAAADTALVSGTTGTTLVLESNPFPTQLGMYRGDLWTIQVMVRGTGRVRIGLMSWESDFGSTYTDWGGDNEVWTLPANGFLHLYALRHIGEGVAGQVRIECDGTDLYVDNVMCEPDWLNGWPYFDGDTTYGAPGDFSWYGGETLHGRSYSLWYNHRRAVIGRLFAWSISDDDFVVTDEEIEKQGFVYKWVPAGVRVIPHMDVLYEGDVQSVVPAVIGSVLPIRTTVTDKTGVYPAWAIASN